MNIESQVRRIIRKVGKDGDRALLHYAKRFDRFRTNARGLEVTRAERKSAREKVHPKVVQALKSAADRIRRFHKRQRPKGWTLQESGIRTGIRWTPLDRVGIYVPGGRAAYPSTVLMNAIPAKVAGVKEIIMTSPVGRDGAIILAIRHQREGGFVDR